MNYLVYIEHAAENLQFYLWYRDYVKRFDAMPAGERALAPVWTVEQAEAEAFNNQNTLAPKTVSPQTAAVFQGTDFAPPNASVVEIKGNPFNTPPMTPTTERDSIMHSENNWSEAGSTLYSLNKSFKKKAGDAFQGADLKWQPCKQTLAWVGFLLTSGYSHHPAIP